MEYVAKKDIEYYAGRSIKVGERFDVERQHVQALIEAGCIEDKSVYKTREMRTRKA